ncbi:MAG: hypothetical protein MK080_01750 [Opitutales bacterium]|nr:hypothetical protein [Opitutales bacterium]
MNIAMIPARMGSQRLAKKNLRTIDGATLIARAVRKCLQANVFDEVWINSEHPDFGLIAQEEGVHFHQRPESLGNNHATSEDYIEEFLQAHSCNTLYQIHSIAPLLSMAEIQAFAKMYSERDFDTLLSTEDIQLECVHNESPVNFSLNEKTNSQELVPVKKISWSISAWNSKTFLETKSEGGCATYSGKVGYYSLSKFASHVIKTEEDLQIAEALLPFTS